MSGIIIATQESLPRSLDVQVNVSKPISGVTSDLSVMVFCTPDCSFDQDANRIRYYSTLNAVADDFATSSEAYKAATAFFGQSPRAQTMAVARIFTSAMAGFLQLSAVQEDVDTWKAVTTGALKITINGVTHQFDDLDFSGATDMDDIATYLQSAIRSYTSGGTPYTLATVENQGNGSFRITSGSVGDGSVVSMLSVPTGGVDIGAAGFLGGEEDSSLSVQTAYSAPGYTPSGLVQELIYISEAATCAGKFVYGWALDALYRDTTDQLLAAAYIETQVGILGLVSNSPFAYDATSTTDIPYLVKAAGYIRTFTIYHNNPYYYPECSILALALSVNYNLPNSTITTKFKDLIGIPTVPMNETQLAVLEEKRCNTFVLIGNTYRTFRQGDEGNSNWYIDDLINLDNFTEFLQVAVYNLFVQKKKVPYTAAGVNMLYSVIYAVCNLFESNGTLAERPVQNNDGTVIVDPAFEITFQDLATVTASQRAMRVGPPAKINCNLAGAIQSITINVEAYS